MKRRDFAKSAAAAALVAIGHNSPATGAVESGLAGAKLPEPIAAKHQPRVRLKSVVEQFDDTKVLATYDEHGSEDNKRWLGGRDIAYGKVVDSRIPGRPLYVPSERTRAIAGAWLLHMINISYGRSWSETPKQFVMTETDKQLVEYAVNECGFVGPLGWDGEKGEANIWYANHKIGNSGMYKNALLNGMPSHGLEPVPVELDDFVMLAPYLEGNLFPYVKFQNVGRMPRGNGDEHGTVADKYKYPHLRQVGGTLTGTVEVGLDFYRDSASTSLAVLEAFRKNLRKKLDDIIASNCTVDLVVNKQPRGVTHTPGVKRVRSNNGKAGPPTLSDYTRLLQTIPREYRVPLRNDDVVFIGTESSYRRSHATRANKEDWQGRHPAGELWRKEILRKRFAYNESVPNSTIVACNLAHYHLYRRLGYSVEVEFSSKFLARKPQSLVLIRQRISGGLADPGAAAVMDDAQK